MIETFHNGIDLIPNLIESINKKLNYSLISNQILFFNIINFLINIGIIDSLSKYINIKNINVNNFVIDYISSFLVEIPHDKCYFTNSFLTIIPNVCQQKTTNISTLPSNNTSFMSSKFYLIVFIVFIIFIIFCIFCYFTINSKFYKK